MRDLDQPCGARDVITLCCLSCAVQASHETETTHKSTNNGHVGVSDSFRYQVHGPGEILSLGGGYFAAVTAQKGPAGYWVPEYTPAPWRGFG